MVAGTDGGNAPSPVLGLRVDAAAALEIRKPLDDLEGRAMRMHVARPDEVSEHLFDALRYVISFARLTEVRNKDGDDISVHGHLAAHRGRVLETLRPHLDGPADALWGAVRELPELVHATRGIRADLLSRVPLDRDSLEEEVTTRQLVVSCGGGGGSGYGYAGAYRRLHRAGLQPELLSGTSMGSLISMFRARRRVFDGLPLVEAARRLNWNTVFRVLEMESRYGLPATLRLYLRSALGHLFVNDDGRPITFNDLEVPLLVVTTGITVDALKHDLSYYEHFLDDAVRPGVVFRYGRLRRLGHLAQVMGEFLSSPEALREIVFGADPNTMDADVLDAAGFSSAVPGVIHYDIIRDDQRMRRLLDGLYAEYGITRLTEGGLVNNVPARPAYAEVMRGRIGRRNPFVVALDCFSPRPRSLAWYAVQQVVRPNVKANIPYSHLYFELERRLSPVNLVPDVDQVTRAMGWTSEELEPHVPFIVEGCRRIRVLPEAAA